MTQRIDFDGVLVVGAGLAGLSAALGAHSMTTTGPSTPSVSRPSRAPDWITVRSPAKPVPSMVIAAVGSARRTSTARPDRQLTA